MGTYTVNIPNCPCCSAAAGGSGGSRLPGSSGGGPALGSPVPNTSGCTFCGGTIPPTYTLTVTGILLYPSTTSCPQCFALNGTFHLIYQGLDSITGCGMWQSREDMASLGYPAGFSTCIPDGGTDCSGICPAWTLLCGCSGDSGWALLVGDAGPASCLTGQACGHIVPATSSDSACDPNFQTDHCPPCPQAEFVWHCFGTNNWTYGYGLNCEDGTLNIGWNCLFQGLAATISYP